MKNNAKFKQIKVGEIPEGWEDMPLANMAELIKDSYKPTGSDDFIYIGLEHINQQSLSLNSIGHSTEVESNKFVFRSGDILFGKLRPYFRKVYRPHFSGVCSTDIWVVRAKDGIDQDFLFYLMANQQFVDISSSGSSGTRMPRADWDYLERTLWSKPPIIEQRAIAKILSDLDEKIELNQQMNKTLEAIGQALFKRWFVDFEFHNDKGKPYKSSGGKMIDSELGMIPEGWRVSTIGNEFKTILGGTPATQNKEYWTDGRIPWINSGKVNDFRITSPSACITQEALENSAAKMMPKSTTVLAITGATLGQVSRIEIDACGNQSVIGIIQNEYIPSEYVYFWLKENIGDLISHQTGGAQQHINKNNVNSMALLVSSENIIKKFRLVIEPIFQTISLNCFESNNFSQIRDSLLPRLMSGKIRV